MKDKKNIIAAVLVVVALVSLIRGAAGPAKLRHGTPAQTGTFQSYGAAQDGVKIIPVKRRSKKTKFTSWGRDPFVPYMLGSKFKLDGIMWQEGRPHAIIGNTVVKVGDEIDGNTVMEIRRDNVIMSDGQDEFKLDLWEDKP